MLNMQSICSSRKTAPRTGGDRRQYSCLVNATDPFPENPPTDAVTFADEKCPDMSVHEMFEKVLQERPVWNKTDLRKKLSLDRALLPKFAFYIQTGPWARLWCRYGYDPRKNPEACLYQSITVSFERFGFTVLDIPDNSAQNEVNWMMPSNLRAGRPTVKNRKTDCGNEYNPGVIPSKRLAAYQLCDVHLPEVQQLVKMRYPHYGWLEQGTIEQPRETIKNDYKRTVLARDKAEELSDPNMPSTSNC
ncbi:hypothetical protein D918_01989 [Trichuris suis]|nr:hypothetical protein D918_01989 [Trichuris suis]